MEFIVTIILWLLSIVDTKIVYAQQPVYNYPVLEVNNDTSNSRALASTSSSISYLEAPTTTVGVFSGETCVTGARLLGANLPKGDAIDLPVGATPQVGGVIKLKYGDGVLDYHVVVILGILKTGYYVGGYNKYGKGEYQEEFISFDETQIIVGFWEESWYNTNYGGKESI